LEGEEVQEVDPFEGKGKISRPKGKDRDIWAEHVGGRGDGKHEAVGVGERWKARGQEVRRGKRKRTPEGLKHGKLPEPKEKQGEKITGAQFSDSVCKDASTPTSKQTGERNGRNKSVGSG